MVAIIVHLVLGFATMVAIVRTNPVIFARYTSGPSLSKLELFYWVAGIASVILGYYFNNVYVGEYAPTGGVHNFLWGPGAGGSSSRSAMPTPPRVRPARTTRS